MSSRLRRILHPDWYQGRRSRSPYFEGWYFKLVDESGANRLAVIPGIFKGELGDEPFVQVFDGSRNTVWFQGYPASEFTSSQKEFDVSIGGNRFRADGIDLQMESGDLQLSGRINFHDTKPWPVTIKSPGIMGWYGWTPFMQCYHGVVSLDHGLSGDLVRNGETLPFAGGRGYTEKDWGRSFPTAWVWIQSNHFEQVGASLSASIAHIPWMGSYFPGFIVGLLVDGELFRFATYTGAKTETLDVTDNRIKWVISDKTHQLQIEADRKNGGLLFAPSPSGMEPGVTESIGAETLVTLSRLSDRSILFRSRGRHSGVEVHGDTSVLFRK